MRFLGRATRRRLGTAMVAVGLAAAPSFATEYTISVWAGGSNANDIYRVVAIEMAAEIRKLNGDAKFHALFANGKLTEKEVNYIRRAAEHYVEQAQRYKKGDKSN